MDFYTINKSWTVDTSLEKLSNVRGKIFCKTEAAAMRMCKQKHVKQDFF